MRIRFHRCVRKWLGLLVVIVAIVVLSTLYYNRVYKSHVDSAVVVISSDQVFNFSKGTKYLNSFQFVFH